FASAASSDEWSNRADVNANQTACSPNRAKGRSYASGRRPLSPRNAAAPDIAGAARCRRKGLRETVMAAKPPDLSRKIKPEARAGGRASGCASESRAGERLDRGRAPRGRGRPGELSPLGRGWLSPEPGCHLHLFCSAVERERKLVARLRLRDLVAQVVERVE